MGQLDLINIALIQSSKELPPGGVVSSPTFQQVRCWELVSTVPTGLDLALDLHFLVRIIYIV